MKWRSLILVAPIMLGCMSGNKKESTNSWSGQMVKMADEVSQLIPYIYNPNEFRAPSNHKMIQEKIEKVAKTAHKIPMDYSKKYLGDDPIIQYSAKNLEGDLKRAEVVFNNGNKDYARSVLKGALNHCFRCHTRNSFGPEYMQWKIDFDAMNISPTSKAQLLIATRQYQKAETELEGFLTEKYGVYSKPFEQDKGLQLYLSLSVRVEKDPKRAIEVLKKIQKNENFPNYLKEDLQQWVRSLIDWSREKNGNEGSLGKANELIKRAKSLKRFSSLETSYVEYLRATAILHDVLNQTKGKKERAQIFYLLGEAYDTLSESGYWELPELYYESCIREYPHKGETSKQCFLGYERNIILGYSGSIGILVPQVEKEKLLELKKLAGLE